MDALKRFQEADWPAITWHLVRYALFKVRRLEWRTGSFLPKGMLPEDLALEAIRKTCEGVVSGQTGRGIRAWDPERTPDLLAHLKSVVDSDVHALVESMEHRLTRHVATHELFESGGAALEARYAPTPEEAILMHESAVSEERRLSKLMEDLYVLCVDDEEELLVLLAYQEAAKKHDKVKPSLVAKYAGLDEKSVRNAMRRLTRKVERRRFHE